MPSSSCSTSRTNDGLHLQRESDVVELHQAAQGGDDDRARAGEADLPRNRRLVAHREIAIVKRQPSRRAVLDEPLDRRLDQPDAAVVAVQSNVAREVVDRVEPRAVIVGQHDLDRVPLVERDLRPVVANAERQRLAVIAVGRIAEQAGTGVGALTSEEHRALPGDAAGTPARAPGRRGRTRRTPRSRPRSCRCRSAARRARRRTP